jgi:hypothetical protein
MKRIGEAELDKCPACLHTIEDAWHILSSDEQVEWQNTFLKNLTDIIHSTNTQPDLTMVSTEK